MGMKERIEFGSIVWCPRCRGKGRRRNEATKMLEDCTFCAGKGIVPNDHPIAPIKKP